VPASKIKHTTAKTQCQLRFPPFAPHFSLSDLKQANPEQESTKPNPGLLPFVPGLKLSYFLFHTSFDSGIVRTILKPVERLHENYINTEFHFSKVELQNIKEWNFKQEARKKNLTLPAYSSNCTDIAIIYIFMFDLLFGTQDLYMQIN
jgi:hypothetical protein